MKRYLIQKESESEAEISDSAEPEQSSSSSKARPRVDLYRQGKKKYDQKFKEEWVSQFKWLSNSKTSSKIGQAFCILCNKTLHNGITHLRRHESNLRHKKHLRAQHISQNLDLEKFKLEAQDTNKNDRITELKLIGFVVEHNLPISIMDHLPSLVKSVCSCQHVKNIKCGRTKSTRIIQDIFQKESISDICKLMQEHYFSIIIDETTDVSVAKALVILVRIFNGFNTKDYFFHLIELESCTAEVISGKIVELLLKYNIPIKNMVGLAADNASVMMGHLGGVQALLKNYVPDLFVLGCTCHSFHLCCSSACLKLPRSIEQFARDVFNYFSNSSKRCLELRECQIFCELKPNKLLRPSQTRWLSLHAVVKNILKNWNPLKLFFQRAALEDRLQSAESILNALNSPMYKLYLLFLDFILQTINKLNLLFQNEKPEITTLYESVTSLYKLVLKFFVKKAVVNNVDLYNIDPSSKDVHLDFKDMYFGAEVENYIITNLETISAEDVQNFKSKCRDFYIELTVQIKKRFDFNNKVLKELNILNPVIATSGKVSNIVNLLRYFPTLIETTDMELINLEWRLLPEIEDLKKISDLEEFWSYICNKKSTTNEFLFPNLKKMAELILVLPHSSAAAERIFSQYALIKTKVRNRLLVESCDSILHAKYYVDRNGGTCYKFEPNDSILRRNIIYANED